MKRVREILRNEYIGAIAIGFLLFQACGTLISTIMQPIITYMENRARPQSIFSAQHSIFNWPQIIVSVISMILDLLVAWLLLFWLYLKKRPEPAVATVPGASPVTEEPVRPVDKPEEPS